MSGLLIFIIRLYQRSVSPFLGPSCRFLPSCSEYALGCLRKHYLLKAIYFICRRIIKCHPFHSGGIDIVPE